MNRNLGCLLLPVRLLEILLGREGTEEVADQHLPYVVRQGLLSGAERSFYGVLRSVTRPLIITFKVRLADLIDVARQEIKEALS